ncbi:MAG: polysaccharide deacetylase family protein [Candidatus Pacearchaeota archaeon]
MEIKKIIMLFAMIIFAFSVVSSLSTINKKVYIVPYMGDIDGSVSEDWFYFYHNITYFFESNKIPAGISFYPGSIVNDSDFMEPFLEMYNNKYIELIQKGYLGDDLEMEMDKLLPKQQKEIIKSGQDAFKLRLREVSISNPNMPTAYNQIHGKFTEDTRKVAEELGLKQYFDVFVEAGLPPVNSTPEFNVIQYGISFTTNGDAGKDTKFKTQGDIFNEINNFDSDYVPLTKIDGILVIPLWVHQQDFESEENKINSEKWLVYTNTLKKLKKEENVTFLLPKEVYSLTNNEHNQPPANFSTQICEYANYAKATSENAGSYARYAAGPPDATKPGCREGQWSGYGYSWTPSNWNVIANLTLSYEKPVYLNNVTILGDYDMCFRNIWGRNSATNETRNLLTGNFKKCTLFKNVNHSFLADTIIIETCGWGWTATDAVQICGKSDGSSVINDVEICDWKNCKKGAVSVSIDDYYKSCIDELDSHGYKGTYFLTNTDKYLFGRWIFYNSIFKRGHELGTHTENHLCSQVSDKAYIADMERNIQQIVAHTLAERSDIITHAYPCGYTNANIQNIMKSNWNFLSARGYNYNELENNYPSNFFDLKSFNSHGYPGNELEPPDYFTVIDKAEKEGKWANLVFHNECNDGGVIDYLHLKNVWVDTIGNVVRYIHLKNNSTISNYNENANTISFTINTPSIMKSKIYKQDLTLKVHTNNKIASRVKIGGSYARFTNIKINNENYAVFDVPFPIQHTVTITLI